MSNASSFIDTLLNPMRTKAQQAKAYTPKSVQQPQAQPKNDIGSFLGGIFGGVKNFIGDKANILGQNLGLLAHDPGQFIKGAGMGIEQNLQKWHQTSNPFNMPNKPYEKWTKQEKEAQNQKAINAGLMIGLGAPENKGGGSLLDLFKGKKAPVSNLGAVETVPGKPGVLVPKGEANKLLTPTPMTPLPPELRGLAPAVKPIGAPEVQATRLAEAGVVHNPPPENLRSAIESKFGLQSKTIGNAAEAQATKESSALQGIRESFMNSKDPYQRQVGAELNKLTSSSGVPPRDPVKTIIQALKEAKPIRVKQEALYSAERSRRVAGVVEAGKIPGEAGYAAQLSQLKGELPKVQFESIRSKIQQPEIDHLFTTLEQSKILTPFEKVAAKGGLAKLLGAEGGVVPTMSEIKLLNTVFPPELTKSILEQRPLIQKLLSGAGSLLNLPRAMMSTLDLSAPLRQGAFLIGRPKQFVPAFKDMFKYALHEKSYQGLMTNIQSRPTYQLMREAKLALTDLSPVLTNREEAFMSNIAERLPGFGTLARGSNRAYSGFLNKLRADTFDDLVKGAQSQGLKVEGKLLNDIAKFVNSATGRGDLGGLSRAAVVLNGAFFSPRLMASRFNLINPLYYTSLSPYVRKEALKSALIFAGTGSTILGLASLGGASVGADPRNSDFGKIKVGNTRYDPWGGFQQYMVLLSRLATNQMVSSTTGKVTNLSQGYKPTNREDIILHFFESKESPVLSFITALAKGQTPTGQPVKIPEEVVQRFIPMVAQDMYDLSQDKDSTGIFGIAPAVFGTGVQTYPSSTKKSGSRSSGGKRKIR